MSMELTLVGNKKNILFQSFFGSIDSFESHLQFQVKQITEYSSELMMKSLTVFGSCKSESKFQNKKSCLLEISLSFFRRVINDKPTTFQALIDFLTRF
jgi:hypothetical protein